MIRVIYIVFCVIVCTPLYAQIKFATTEIREINDLLVNSRTVTKLEIIKKIDDDSTLVHIGYKLFSDTIKSRYPSALYDFIERYTLHISLLNLQDRKQKMQDDKVAFQVQSLWLINDSMPFFIESNTKEYSVTWKTLDGVQVAKIVFPKNFQLIYGLNLIESDLYFMEAVTTYTDTIYEQVKFLKCDVEAIDSTLFVERGRNFDGSSSVNSNKYFTISTDTNYVEPIKDTRALEAYLASISNFLTTENYDLNVTQKGYGYKNFNYSVPIQQVTAYCVHQNCEPYIGIEKDDGDTIKAIIIYENPDYNYNHLLCLDIPHNVLRNKHGDINCCIYSYIPTCNLKNK